MLGSIENRINSNRIVKNTILLFVRLGVLTVVNILAVRFVRAGLGVEEYGVITALTGIVQMMLCVNTMLASASQRFFSVALGQNNQELLADSFRISIRLCWKFAIVLLVLFETFGLWFVCTKMQYPIERQTAVLVAYQASIFTFLSMMVQIPYLAAVMAHEKMNVFAGVSILEATLKLLLAIGIMSCPWDKLIVYSMGLLAFSLLSTLLYVSYGKRHFTEIQNGGHGEIQDKTLTRQMLAFSGWSMFGCLAGILMLQGNILLLNVYQGAIVNAAFAVSVQVFTAFSQLSNNVLMAVRPQMTMSYSASEFQYLNRLHLKSSQGISALMLAVAIPFLVWMPQIVELWLGDADILTVTFCRLMIIHVIVQSLGAPCTVIMQAAGRVKEYHTYVEIPTLLCFPLCWLLLAMGMPAATTVWAMIGCCMLANFVRIERVNRYYPQFELGKYIWSFFVPANILLVIIMMRLI